MGGLFRSAARETKGYQMATVCQRRQFCPLRLHLGRENRAAVGAHGKEAAGYRRQNQGGMDAAAAPAFSPLKTRMGRENRAAAAAHSKDAASCWRQNQGGMDAAAAPAFFPLETRMGRENRAAAGAHGKEAAGCRRQNQGRNKAGPKLIFESTACCAIKAAGTRKIYYQR